MIEIKNLSKTYHTADGTVEALKNVSLRIPDGDIFGIIGMSGAGKSTLVRCINMLERPSEGSVEIDGIDLAILLGLPLGVLLVVGEKDGILPLPSWLLRTLNATINLLRSVPFLILMILLFPLTRLLVGTVVGTTACIVPQFGKQHRSRLEWCCSRQWVIGFA